MGENVCRDKKKMYEVSMKKKSTENKTENNKICRYIYY